MANLEEPKKIRAFIAIHADAATVAELERVQNNLERGLPSDGIRWAKSEQLHLTLQFLGYIVAERLPEFEKILSDACSQHGPFGLRAETLGCFPDKRKPRILWAGLNGDVEPLENLKRHLDEKLAAVGYVAEKRAFHPHITLARIDHLKIREIEQLGRQLVSYEAVRFGAWRVEKIDLMRSILSPAGAKYSLLKSFGLKAA